jgi:glycosyltransferase involved in cell wall biosynthesis
LIEEVASIQDEKTKLLLCGHPEPDTGPLKALAKKKLGNKVQWHTLPPSEIPIALKAADVFVMTSTYELFGSAGVEAALSELPVIMHPHGASSMLLEHGFQATDLSQSGNLATRLQELRKTPADPEELRRIAASIRSSFSETTLTQRFVKMVQLVADQG